MSRHHIHTPASSLQPRTTFSNQSIVSLVWFIALRMPYRDTPNDDDGDGGDGDDYPFARPATTKEKSNRVKEKKAAARERKRQLEDKIRSSMKTLKSPTGEKNPRLSESYQSSYQCGGEGTYSGDTMNTTTSTSASSSSPLYSSSRNHATNSPLPSAHHTNSGILYSLVQCIGDAVRLGTSEIVEQHQPSALYESIRSPMTWLPSTRTTATVATNEVTPSSYSSWYDPLQGSYQNVESRGYSYQRRG